MLASLRFDVAAFAHALLQIGDGRAVSPAAEHIVRADIGNGVRLIAVHIDERLEAALFAAVEQPIDGALLIDLQVVGVEVVQEVIANDVLFGWAPPLPRASAMK